MIRIALPVASLFACLVFPANAQPAPTTSDTVRKWGLIGEWSTEDCRLPLAARQRQTVWYRVDPDGEVIMDMGGVVIIEAAEITNEGNLTVRMIDPTTNRKQVNVFAKTVAGMRPIMSRSAALDYAIKDGIETATGKPHNEFRRC